MLRNWPRKIRGCYDGVSSLMQFSNSARRILRIYLWRRRRARFRRGFKFVAREWRRNRMFFLFRFQLGSPDSTILLFFPFSSEFWSVVSKWERAVRGPPSRKYAGLKALARFTLLSKCVLKRQRSRGFHVKKILLDYSSNDLEKIRVLRFEISIDFSRRESII